MSDCRYNDYQQNPTVKFVSLFIFEYNKLAYATYRAIGEPSTGGALKLWNWCKFEGQQTSTIPDLLTTLPTLSDIELPQVKIYNDKPDAN
jgi:hypothetical protein